jgi:tetratricopeptide (TPR) repeat protein
MVEQQGAPRLSSTSSRLILIGVALAILVGGIYGRVVQNGFIDYDDPAYVTDNQQVRSGLTLDTAAWALRTGYHANWHPLTWMSHALDCALFGLNPAGHHLVSVGLHAANAVLLFLALHALTGALWRSAAVAALFAAHPLHVESVAWVAERKDVLSTLFAMLVLLAYARHAVRPTRVTRALIPIFFALGLMAKPMLVTLPFVLLLLDVWPLRRWSHLVPPFALIREKLPLFALAAASSVVTWLVQQRGGAVTPLEVLPIGTRIGTAAIAYVTYLARMCWPERLGVLYPVVFALPGWKVIGACAILAAITTATVTARRRAPYLAVGWLWYLGTLVPVIGIVQVGVQSTADRYTYLPLVGVFVMIAWGLPDLFGASRLPPAAIATAGAVAIAACSLLAWRQIGHWRDSETIFTHTLATTSGNYVIHSNLGGVLLRENRIDEAVSHLEEARRIRPNHAATLSNLGVAAMRRGNLDEAVVLFREALRVNPSHVEARLNLEAVLEKQRAAAPATTVPAAMARFERGNALRDRGRLGDAEAAYREAIGLDSRFAQAHNNLGSLLGRQGRFDDAVAQISRALELAPNLAAAHNNLGIVLAIQGRIDEAAKQFAEVLRADPRDASAHYNLGAFLAKHGRTADAIAHFEEALRIDPGYASARRALDEVRRR